MRNIVLFDEPTIREQLYPVSLTRSIAGIRVGIATIAEKWGHWLEGDISYQTEPYLQEKFPSHLTNDNWFIASHILPDKNIRVAVARLQPGETLYHLQHLIAFRGADWESRKHPSAKIEYTQPVDTITHPFHIFQHNSRELRHDFEWYIHNVTTRAIPAGTIILGKHPVVIAESAKLTACILNAEEGPIFIGEESLVMEGSCIRGPFAMLEGSVVKMGSKIYGATTLGPHSMAGGEIKNAVFTGYSNKSHDGYLGDAVIGEWCNLGANTNVSNLKNNIGTIRVWSEAVKSYIVAGKKCGVIMGDYSRCGISTMLNTGTVIGVSCNIFGGDFPPKHIPSFSWGGASKWMNYELEKALQDAAAWMELKKVKMTKSDENILSHIHITKTSA
jgi:UDP-N-acetylglucosamine diphosphorylase/glucosamine-1-phosphate N-acetyltransferase